MLSASCFSLFVARELWDWRVAPWKGSAISISSMLLLPPFFLSGSWAWCVASPAPSWALGSSPVLSLAAPHRMKDSISHCSPSSLPTLWGKCWDASLPWGGSPNADCETSLGVQDAY